jgi:transposase-like protein
LGGPGGGEVEIDETVIGGKGRNMHYARKMRAQTDGRNTGGKTTVLGMVERAGTVRAKVISNRKRKNVEPIIREKVETGSKVMTDDDQSGWWTQEEFEHEAINHPKSYVDGNVHTNTIENFWSLLKRGLSGTYISVEPFHLFRYVDEQAWRYNNRAMDDIHRFIFGMRQIIGKRLTYEQLTGKFQLAHR